MSNKTIEKRPWRDRITDRYRLIILNDETLKETNNYKLNLLNLYVLACTLFLIIGIIVFLLLSYTPLKHIIPGYGDIKATPEFLALREKTEKLEGEIIALNNYIDANKNRILGNTQKADEKMLKGSYEPNEIDYVEKETVEEKLKTKTPSKIRFFYPPIKGEVSSAFDSENRHHGIDVLAEKNTPIACINAGTVILAEYNIETGNTISVQHADNVVSTYKHNSKLLKIPGDYVKTGEAIAIIGNSGIRTDGYHLHFELWMEGEAVDPSLYIDFNN
jgi:murein DD-endopeptidase MepM/ murein hydrolase activator NlpD